MVAAAFAALLVSPVADAQPTPDEVFEKRIAPIFKSPNPSSCVQCHLACVDLKNYIRPSSRETFLSLRDQGRTVFFSSHILSDAELICDRVAILDKGIVRTVGRVDDITRQSSAPVAIVVKSDESAVRAALARFEIRNFRPLEAERLRVELTAPEQHDVDGAIDALRSRGISILSVSRTLLTLEQAFLQLVQNGEKNDRP